MVLPEGLEPTRLSATSSQPGLAANFSMVALNYLVLVYRRYVPSVPEFLIVQSFGFLSTTRTLFKSLSPSYSAISPKYSSTCSYASSKEGELISNIFFFISTLKNIMFIQNYL